jgi:hypothetical protein
MTSDSLINVADRYIDLDHIKEDIQKASRASYSYRPLSSAGVAPVILDSEHGDDQPHGFR